MAKANRAATGAAAASKAGIEAQQAATSEEGGKSSDVQLTAAQIKKLEELPTASAKMRYLDSEGYTRSQIAKALNKRYQHVRNVLITPVGNPTGKDTPRGSVTAEKPEEDKKSSRK